MATSDCVGEATTVVEAAVLLAVLGSVGVAETVAVLEMTVPGAVPVLTLTTSGKLAPAPEATEGFVQLTVPAAPTAGVVQVQPAGTGAKDTKVVFVGMTSVNEAPVATAGPLLVTVDVKAMLLPTVTGLGDAVLVTAMSAWPAVATTTFAVAVLLFGFGSGVVAETFAVSVMTVPEAVPAVTLTTTVKVVDAPAANVGFEQVRVPAVTPQVHPAAGTGVAET
jgi:hypothetical protein